MRTLIIKLDRQQLLTEVHNTTYFTGRSRFTGDNPEQVANMQSDEEEECLIRGYLEGGLQRAATFLSAIAGDGLTQYGKEYTHTLPGGASVEYPLSLPGNFDMGQIPAIASAIHRGVVAYAVGEWFLVSNPGEAAVYFEKANAAFADLRSAICKRVGPLRRKTNP